METFYWHDYETWGINPAEDKPSQFAGVRTDYNFNIVGEPLNILCKPAIDTLPHVEACLVTGLTPQKALAEGVTEREFFAAIHSELARPQTCAVGYNSIRFDDEVTRYGFYRNFYDPYAREWQSGSSRWDIIDMLRLCYAVRPDDFEWPRREDGVVSFRLEKLTEANGLAHEAAHDALSDVYATIAMAKLVKQKQPKLFQHVFEFRNKKNVQQALALGSYKPKLHISSRFSADIACASLILPMALHPKNKNEVLCIDLRYSPQPLLDLSCEELAEYIFTRVENLPSGIERIPLKSVHLNRSPVVLSPGLLDENIVERMQINLAQCELHRKQIIEASHLPQKLESVYALLTYDAKDRDIEAMLYDGFFSNNDKQIIQGIPFLDGERLAKQNFIFEDSRLPELLFRYRARNFPDSLSSKEMSQWLEQCNTKLMPDDGLLANELARIGALELAGESDKVILDAVSEYLQGMQHAFSEGLLGVE